ncbi:hypothetical protein HU200_011175 [Digitaria exilis]|uniref:Uncharacterized protein n=1 Tax=Digitaria exilis TaxID=1010633 RepID=A0A835FI41_9POAL|nr:hypothetical protein HU200_011175 [Digitaria exilis]
MVSKSGELRMTLLGVALLGLLLLSQHAATVEATGSGAAPTGKKTNSFSFNSAGGRTLNSFSMNAGDHGKKGGKGF